MGRPKVYSDDTDVYLRPDGSSKLHNDSDRKAIVLFLVEQGGKATMKEIDDYFGFPVRDRVIGLIRAGWLAIEPVAAKRRAGDFGFPTAGLAVR